MEGRVLVVDDLAIWRDIISELLQDRYSVDTADSLSQAIATLDAYGPYDVVVTDIGLAANESNTDGIDLLKLIYKRSPQTKTIAVSGRAAIADRDRFRQEYHTMVYLDRSELSDNLYQLVEWVDHGVNLARGSQKS
jgi:DNA-binding NtrC family response regulator